MEKIGDFNFINIQGWMINELGLKNNELLIYACIYGFSQDGESKFSGSANYLAQWTSSSKRNVLDCLNSLVEKGYIIKYESNHNGVKFCDYAVSPSSLPVNKVHHPDEESSLGGGEESSPHNIFLDINKEKIETLEVNKNKKKESLKKETLSFDEEVQIVEETDLDSRVKDVLKDWVTYKKERGEAYKPTGLKSFLKIVQNNVNKFGSKAVEEAVMKTMSNNYQGVVWDYCKNSPQQIPKSRYKELK